MNSSKYTHIVPNTHTTKYLLINYIENGQSSISCSKRNYLPVNQKNKLTEILFISVFKSNTFQQLNWIC